MYQRDKPFAVLVPAALFTCARIIGSMPEKY
jgi:hypothetical protein